MAGESTLTRAQFAAEIKAKHPQYVKVPDDQLVTAMLKKYPQYEKRIAAEAPQTPAAPPPARGKASIFGFGLKPEMAEGLKQYDVDDVMGQPIAPNAIGGARTLASQAAKLLPKARASSKFATVAGAASGVPVDISGPGNAALQAITKAERGGTTPRAVTQFIRRITDPNKGPLDYDEARDWASNISRLSADEWGRLTPVMKTEIANLRVALHKAIEQAAGTVGHAGTYRSALKQYARAAEMEKMAGKAWSGLKRGAGWAGVAGAGTYVGQRLSDLLRD